MKSMNEIVIQAAIESGVKFVSGHCILVGLERLQTARSVETIRIGPASRGALKVRFGPFGAAMQSQQHGQVTLDFAVRNRLHGELTLPVDRVKRLHKHREC